MLESLLLRRLRLPSMIVERIEAFELERSSIERHCNRRILSYPICADVGAHAIKNPVLGSHKAGELIVLAQQRTAADRAVHARALFGRSTGRVTGGRTLSEFQRRARSAAPQHPRSGRGRNRRSAGAENYRLLREK